jgi:hypothetical protein
MEGEKLTPGERGERKLIDQWKPMELACSIGMDALRVAIGGEPVNFSVAEIVKWLRIMESEADHD